MKHQHGFTLIELAVVLTIIALLIGSLLIPLTTQIDVAKIRSTEKTLEQVKEALIHYAVANNRLPCPATDVDTGLEVNTVMNCQMEGYFPWANLGMGRYDAWGNPFIYRVDQMYTQEIMTPNLTSLPDTFSNIEVRDIQNNPVVDSDVVAIIYSTGKNGEAYQPATQFPNFMGTNSHLWLPLKTISNLIIAPAFALDRGSDDIYYQDSLIPNKYDDVLIFLSKSHLVAVSQRVQTTTVAVVMPVLDDSVYSPELETPVVDSTGSEQTGNTGSTNSDSTEGTSTTDTGSNDAASSGTDSTDTPSTDTASNDNPSTTDTASNDAAASGTGASENQGGAGKEEPTTPPDNTSNDPPSNDNTGQGSQVEEKTPPDNTSNDPPSNDNTGQGSQVEEKTPPDNTSNDGTSTDNSSTTDTGSTGSGSTDSGSTDTGSTDSGSTDTGSTDSGSTDGGMNRSGDGFNPDGDFGGLMGGGFLQQFDNQP